MKIAMSTSKLAHVLLDDYINNEDSKEGYMRTRIAVSMVAALVTCALTGTNAYAVPSLGVASTYGYVNATDPYQTYWGPTLTGPAGQDGFAIGPSGSPLYVFTNIAGADIYILTTSDVATGNLITFNDSLTMYPDTGTFRSYEPTPYYGTNLGAVDASTWTPLASPSSDPAGPFTPGQFYALAVNVDYTGTLGTDQWIFAAADDNGLAGLQAKDTKVYYNSNGVDGIQEVDTLYWVYVDRRGRTCYSLTKVGSRGSWQLIAADSYSLIRSDSFTIAGNISGDSSSPKTTSARGWQVPEPSMLLLLGSGFIGLGLMRRRRN